MRHYISLFITLGVLWLLLSGHYTFEHPLVAITGLLSCALILWLSRRMDIADAAWDDFYLTPHKVARYQVWLIKEIILANLDVAKRILSPSAIEPVMHEVKASQKTAMGRVTFANSITLTPGTVSVKLKDDSILIHALSEDGAKSFDDGEMDRRVSELEPDEETQS